MSVDKNSLVVPSELTVVEDEMVKAAEQDLQAEDPENAEMTLGQLIEKSKRLGDKTRQT